MESAPPTGSVGAVAPNWMNPLVLGQSWVCGAPKKLNVHGMVTAARAWLSSRLALASATCVPAVHASRKVGAASAVSVQNRRQVPLRHCAAARHELVSPAGSQLPPSATAGRQRAVIGEQARPVSQEVPVARQRPPLVPAVLTQTLEASHSRAVSHRGVATRQVALMPPSARQTLADPESRHDDPMAQVLVAPVESQALPTGTVGISVTESSNAPVEVYGAPVDGS